MTKVTKNTMEYLHRIKVVQARQNYLCTEENCRKLIPKGRKHYTWISRSYDETYFRACSINCLNKLIKTFGDSVYYYISKDVAKLRHLNVSYPRMKKDVNQLERLKTK